MSLFDKDAWVVVNEDGEPLGQDRNSGGYPYLPSTIAGVYYFYSRDDAQDYVRVFMNSSRNEQTPVSVVRVRLVRVY